MSDSYLRATEGELPGAPLARRLPGYSNQRRLFPHQRPLPLTPRTLVLGGWRVIRRETLPASRASGAVTSAPGPAATVAIAMAVFPELPMAGLYAVLAIRYAPGCTVWHRHKSPHEQLTLLTTSERHGFEPARELGTRGPIIAREGTLYLLLARLRRNGRVETSWQESHAGPPRRYDHLTSDGELTLASFNKRWRVFRDAVDEIHSEGSRQ